MDAWIGQQRRVSTMDGKKERGEPIAIRHLLESIPSIGGGRSSAVDIPRKTSSSNLLGSNPSLGGGRSSVEDVPHKTSSSRPKPLSLEKEMDSSVENLFRHWDTGMTSSRDVRRRPRTSSSDVRRRPLASTGTADGTQGSGGSQGRRRPPEVPELEIIRRDELLGFDSSDDSFEETATRRPLYVDCAETGQRKFRLEFDAEGFAKENISVTLAGNRLEVHAIQEEMDGGRKSTNEFFRRIRLPADVDRKALSCALLEDGKILIEAPLLLQQQQTLPRSSRPASRSSIPQTGSPSSLQTQEVEALNVPVVKDKDGSKVLSLAVEVGRVFRSDDVVVKMKNPWKILVTAERSERTETSRLEASLVREFDLPAKIASQTLKAGLTIDGLLRITADLLPPDQGQGPPGASAINNENL